MHLSLANAVGYVAAVVGTSIMVPQVLKMIWKRKADDVSLAMAILYCFNCALWFTYGWLISALPVIIANAIALGIGILQVVLKQKYSRPKGKSYAGKQESSAV